MSSTMMVERTGMGVPGMSFPGYGPSAVGYGAGQLTQQGVNYVSVPRCTLKVEKVSDGFKVQCVCDDVTACGVMQNLCQALAGGLCCCQVTWNGMTVCSYNCTLGLCRWEVIDRGVCLTCTTGDSKCSSTLQSWCDCLTSMLNAGCQCCFYVQNTPVCCGGVESATSKTSSTTSAKR
jgi:hypothetical protein